MTDHKLPVCWIFNPFMHVFMLSIMQDLQARVTGKENPEWVWEIRMR